jgi:hypothetical protein
MFQDDPAWIARQRTHWLRPDAHLLVRPDAHRFMPPGAPRLIGKDAVRFFWPDAASDRRAPALAQKYDGQLAAVRASLLALRRQAAALAFALKFRRLLREKGYNADQPRVPAGNPDGGQWTDGGGLSNSLSQPVLAGLVPKVPGRKPPSARERNAVIKAVATWLAEKGLAVSDYVKRNSWLYEAFPYISAYLDEPRSLNELHELVSSAGKGYDIHHIVEQTPAERDGFPQHLINRDDNLVRIPTLKHWQINAWYQTRNREFGGLSPRSYLRGKHWEERRKVGLDVLTRFGVLRP